MIPLNSSSPSRYELIASVGRGKFSEVFKARDRETGEYVSIKHLKPIRKRKIRKWESWRIKTGREIKIMQNLSGGPSIIPLLDTVKDEETGSPNIVTRWVNTIPYRVGFCEQMDFRSSTPVLATTSFATTSTRC